MRAKNILFINSEMTPYLPATDLATRSRTLVHSMQARKHEVRTCMPKWGIINERRNMLHEVIRLSGTSVSINGSEHQLQIKVASLQVAKTQIYFIDGEDYFRRKGMWCDSRGREYADLGERSIFFVRGLMDTVKRLNWKPDLVHCSGWMAAMAPLYLKKAIANDPTFANVKVVMSLTGPVFKKILGKKFFTAISFGGVTREDIADICPEDTCDFNQFMKIGVKYADGIIYESKKVDESLKEYVAELGKPLLRYKKEERIADEYEVFYEKVMRRRKVVVPVQEAQEVQEVQEVQEGQEV